MIILLYSINLQYGIEKFGMQLGIFTFYLSYVR